MPKTIVILGAGYAGLPAAHHMLKYQAEKLDLKIVLVSPADDYYWALATPRVVVPQKMDDDKIFFNIPKLFEKYPASRFEFVHGKAETWDPDTNSVHLTMNDGTSRTIDYHTIIVATGTAAKNKMPWKLVGSSQDTRAALADLREQIKNAKSIVVGGGGATGVEVAGELGSAYAKVGAKSVTILTSDSMLLEKRIMERVRKDASKSLGKLKVKVMTSVRVTNNTQDEQGATVLEITRSDGAVETLKTDLFIPTWGLQFNSDFAPAGMRLPNGRLKVTRTKQAPGYSNTFIVGDVAEGEDMQISYAENHVRHVLAAFGKYLAGGEVPEYVPRSWFGHLVSIGPEYATGQVAGYKPWNWLIWYFKARTLGTDYAPACAEGQRFVVSGSL